MHMRCPSLHVCVCVCTRTRARECRLLAYFIFAMLYMRRVQAVADHADRTTVTLGDYAVKVTNLPDEVPPNEIKTFFEQRIGEGLVSALST